MQFYFNDEISTCQNPQIIKALKYITMCTKTCRIVHTVEFCLETSLAPVLCSFYGACEKAKHKMKLLSISE